MLESLVSNTKIPRMNGVDFEFLRQMDRCQLLLSSNRYETEGDDNIAGDVAKILNVAVREAFEWID